MDLVNILEGRISNLAEGDYKPGLRAVLSHIRAAIRHFDRARNTNDDPAFTDVIYRTNQAFEGSLKEAYRVLADRSPNRKTPNQIERYIEGNNILRPRVLAQFTSYRTEWRNPSTHDYILEFDEDEALLAIVSVTAFAIVLTDQILEKVSFVQTRDSITVDNTEITTDSITVSADGSVDSANQATLLNRAVTVLEKFVDYWNHTFADSRQVREVQIIGALTGFFASVAPDIKFQAESRINDNTRLRADLILSLGDEKLLIEVKRRRESDSNIVEQVSKYMAIGVFSEAILFTFFSPNTGNIIKREIPASGTPGKILDISVERPQALDGETL